MSDDRYILDGKSFVDTKTNQCLNFGIKDLARVTITLNNMDMWLNQAEERIAELEEQLKNAIVPKFKIGQEVWYIYGKKIKSFTISKIEIEIRFALIIAYSNPYVYQFEENCFATKEEAQAKLKELQGE